MKPVVIGNATLYLGDCLEVLSGLRDGCQNGDVSVEQGRGAGNDLKTRNLFDALITDPPYGVDFIGKATKHTKATHTEPGGYIGGDSEVGPVVVRAALEVCDRGVVFPGNRMLFDYPKPYEMGCVYCPSGAGLGRWGFTVFHPMLFYGMGLPETRQGPSGFESFDTQPANGHPCPKPVKWMRWAIAKCTREGMTVLDPFMGSGTTGVAAHETSRKFIGIEIEPKYFDIACERIENAQRQVRMFA